MGDIKTEPLQILEYGQGVILPSKLCDGGPMWGLGGVCDSNNKFVNASFYDGGWAKHGGYYAWKEEAYIDKEVVYVGLFTAHWGHFLIDMTMRLWCLRKLCEKNPDILVAYLGDEIPQNNGLEFFKLLGVREEQLLQITEPTRFQKVYVPEQSFQPCVWYTKEFVAMYDDISAQALCDETAFARWRDVRKVYFTRRNFSKAKASEFGEEYFQKIFVQNGYEPIAPESLSLQEQIYLWNHAEEIICMNGSIPLNVLFCRNSELKLVILNKMSLVHENPYVLLRMRNVEAEFVDIYKEPLQGYPKSLGEGPYLLWNTEMFRNFCDKRKMRLNWKRGKVKRYFFLQQMRYYWAITGISYKIRVLRAKILPKKLKNMIKRLL